MNIRLKSFLIGRLPSLFEAASLVLLVLYLPQLDTNLPLSSKEKTWQLRTSFAKDQEYAAKRALVFKRHMEIHRSDEWKLEAFKAEDAIWNYILKFHKLKAFREDPPTHICICTKEHPLKGKNGPFWSEPWHL